MPQAYTNELELEIAHLLEENAKLRRQQEKVTYQFLLVKVVIFLVPKEEDTIG